MHAFLPYLLTRGMLILALGIGSLALPARAGAQTPLTPRQLEQLREQMQGRPATGSELEVSERDLDTAAWSDRGPMGPLLDRLISRTEYRLGAGDRLILSIFGFRNQLIPLSVTPEGSVIVPTVGIVRVAGLNLEEATRLTRQRVRRVYPDSEVDVSLAAVRSFRVFVAGHVPEPGARIATAVTRVSEIVPVQDEQGVIYRNIELRRGGRLLVVDLARFRRTGDVAHNPFLQEGDVIYIPPVDETVTVSGEVPFPGTYEFRSPESLADLVRLGNGGDAFMARAADTLILMRFSRNPRGEIHLISRADAVGALGSGMVLEPFDALFVPRHGDREQTAVTVHGEVMKPGRYPIIPNTTTIRDVVEMAGGFTAEASVTEAVLQRARSGPESDMSQPLANIPPEMLTREEIRIMQVVSRADERNVRLNISPFSPAFELPLTSGDLLFVPKRRDEVVVLGAVRRPGLVVYNEGQTLDDFIEAVGGYTRRAHVNGVTVLRAKTGARLQRRDLDAIEPGDQIVVPFRENTSFVERLQTTQGVVNTLSGVVLTIVGLERIWNALTR
jgi:polysaccharide biosynthesis/export protein